MRHVVNRKGASRVATFKPEFQVFSNGKMRPLNRFGLKC
jgi:hypothetical protein